MAVPDPDIEDINALIQQLARQPEASHAGPALSACTFLMYMRSR
jgi:hypothetical protein